MGISPYSVQLGAEMNCLEVKSWRAQMHFSVGGIPIDGSASPLIEDHPLSVWYIYWALCIVCDSCATLSSSYPDNDGYPHTASCSAPRRTISRQCLRAMSSKQHRMKWIWKMLIQTRWLLSLNTCMMVSLSVCLCSSLGNNPYFGKLQHRRNSGKQNSYMYLVCKARIWPRETVDRVFANRL